MLSFEDIFWWIFEVEGEKFQSGRMNLQGGCMNLLGGCKGFKGGRKGRPPTIYDDFAGSSGRMRASEMFLF